MEPKETALYARDALLRAGADKSQVMLTRSIRDELYVENGKIALNRTTHNHEIKYKAIRDRKQGLTMAGRIDKTSIDSEAIQVMELAGAAVADEARDIAEYQEPAVFADGPEGSDKVKMYARLREFLDQAGEKHPDTIIENGGIVFNQTEVSLVNSNGVDFASRTSHYEFFAIFTTKKDKLSSSMNYTGCVLADPDVELMKTVLTERLLEQSAGQTKLRALEGKFTGDIIMTPDCLGDFYRFLIKPLYDNFLIGGTSIYKDKLNKPITDKRITLHSRPVGDEMAGRDYIGPDGYVLKNNTIIDKGILTGFLTSQYGALKTGFPRAGNLGTHPVFEPGDSSLDEMIKSVRRGLLLCRFSGGDPSYGGDFSGVAKNSYYIENGMIQYPVSEVMVSGNIPDMLNNLNSISAERINFGTSLMPWMSFGGVTVSGK
jgi:PmbA protein